jgi:hypothetical protein
MSAGLLLLLVVVVLLLQLAGPKKEGRCTRGLSSRRRAKAAGGRADFSVRTGYCKACAVLSGCFRACLISVEFMNSSACCVSLQVANTSNKMPKLRAERFRERGEMYRVLREVRGFTAAFLREVELSEQGQ